MSYRVGLSKSASTFIRHLDKEMMTRVLDKIAWLGNNFETVTPVRLKGKYSGLYKFRIGNYRLVYSIDHQNQELFVLFFDHRKNVYRKP